MNADQNPLRLLPAVERVLNLAPVRPHCEQFGRATVTAWVREILASLRRAGGVSPLLTRNRQSDTFPTCAEEVESLIVQRVHEAACTAAAQLLKPVINATGVVIHTNLGRAPLATAAIQALNDAAGCTNLEVDLQTGQRGQRGAAVERLCRDITGAEAALVVNNCAAATLLTLQTLAAGRRVVISRGQLIEIGGSFRLPDVFRQAGVELHEVGTTNRTRLKDYAEAIGPETAALLRVHPSNYRVTGFVESVPVAELADLARQRQLPMIDDVGSGCLYDLARFGLPDEPIVPESVRAGASLVLFSGDKLLGGPQCGIIVGRAEFIARLRANPLARALRVDKLTLAALQATLEVHRAGRALDEIPVLRQLTMPAEEIRGRAEQMLERSRSASPGSDFFSIQPVSSAPGGGALPEQMIPSWAISIACPDPDDFARQLRLGNPAVFARVQEGRVQLDLRTVLPGDEEALLARIIECVMDKGDAEILCR